MKNLLASFLLFVLVKPAFAIDQCLLAEVFGNQSFAIRENASDKAKIIAKVAPSTRFAVVSNDEAWFRIVAGNFTGNFIK